MTEFGVLNRKSRETGTSHAENNATYLDSCWPYTRLCDNANFTRGTAQDSGGRVVAMLRPMTTKLSKSSLNFVPQSQYVGHHRRRRASPDNPLSDLH